MHKHQRPSGDDQFGHDVQSKQACRLGPGRAHEPSPKTQSPQESRGNRQNRIDFMSQEQSPLCGPDELPTQGRCTREDQQKPGPV